jgi:hypothetical protein
MLNVSTVTTIDSSARQFIEVNFNKQCQAQSVFTMLLDDKPLNPLTAIPGTAGQWSRV